MASVAAARATTPASRVSKVQRKYVYEVHVKSLDLQRRNDCNLAVLWTRGSKQAMTAERSCAASSSSSTTTSSIEYGESLSLICSLIVTDGFQEKLCTFAAIEQRASGMRVLGKCKVDIATFAALDGTPTVAQPLELRLMSKGVAEVGTLHLLVSCRCLDAPSDAAKEGGGGGGRAPTADALPPPPPASLLTMADTSRISEALSDFSDDMSDFSSQTSETDDAPGRLADLDDFAMDEAPAAVPPPASFSAAAAAAEEEEEEEAKANGKEEGAAAGSDPAAAAPPPRTSPARVTFCSPSPSSSPPVFSTSGGSGGGGSGGPTAAGRRRAATAYASPDVADGIRSALLLSSPPNGGSGGDGVATVAASDASTTATASSSPHAALTRCHTVSAVSATTNLSSGFEPSELARIEADRAQLEAQATASLAMHKRVTARLDGEREEWRKEKMALEESMSVMREQMLEQSREARQRKLESRKLTTELAEVKAEASRLRQEKETLLARVDSEKAKMLMDGDDSLALQAAAQRRDLEGKLEESEKHRQEVARKMTKAHKRQENLLAQFEAEVEMLSDKVDMLEDECCEAEQSRLQLEVTAAEAEKHNRSLRDEVERYQSREAAIVPAGVQELQDQLEMAAEVKSALVEEIASRTDELAALKVECAQVKGEREEAGLRLRRSEQKGRLLAMRMTKLEVQLAEAQNAQAEEEEEKAQAFKMALDAQEETIRDLEVQLAEAAKKGHAKKMFSFV